MSTGNKILLWIGFPLVFVVGIITDRIIKDFPYIEWDNKVSFISALSLIITIVISIMIPLFIKKLIDDNRDIKTFLVEEVKDLIKVVSSIRDIISNAHSISEFKRSDCDEIIYIFHSAELKVESIEDQLEISFKKQSQDTIQNLKNALSIYKRYLTDGEMMISTFDKVNDNFYKENNNEYSKVETAFKKAIHSIHKY